MSLNIPQRVDKGIELLQVYLPDGQWALRLDLAILNMQSTGRCVLGQLAPHFNEHLTNAWSPYISVCALIESDQDVTSVHEHGDWTADYGFQSALAEWRGVESEFDQTYPDLAGANVTDMEEYGMLQAEWVKRIEQIKEASDG